MADSPTGDNMTLVTKLMVTAVQKGFDQGCEAMLDELIGRVAKDLDETTLLTVSELVDYLHMIRLRLLLPEGIEVQYGTTGDQPTD